jgi:hypothetical protein
LRGRRHDLRAREVARSRTYLSLVLRKLH